jgi:hypothetical protein
LLQVPAYRGARQRGDLCQPPPANRARSAATQLCPSRSRSPRAVGWQPGGLLGAALSRHQSCAPSGCRPARTQWAAGRSTTPAGLPDPKLSLLLLTQASTAELGESTGRPADQPPAPRRPASTHPWRKPLVKSKRTKSLDINTLGCFT